MPTRLTVALVLAASLLSLPQPASAGTYDVYSCRLPDGTPAPTYGWTPFSQGGIVGDTCATGGLMRASLRPELRYTGDVAGWSVQAPPDTRIIGFAALRYAETSVDPALGSRDFFTAYDDRNPLDFGGPSWREYCLSHLGCNGLGISTVAPLDPLNRTERTGLDLIRLGFQIRCWSWSGSGHCDANAARPGEIRLFQTRVTLADDTKPAIEAVSGLVAGGAPSAVSGTVRVEIDAVDRGAGLAEAVLIVDGASQSPVPVASVSCRTPYVDFRPCPQAGKLTATLDTAQIPDGQHQVVVAVRDAAGNETRSDPFAVVIDSAARLGAPNGAPVSRFAKLNVHYGTRGSALSKIVDFGRSAALSGRLISADGTPIAGASIAISRTLARPNSVPEVIGSALTSADGTFQYRVAAGPSAMLTVSYTAFSNDPAPVASAHLRLTVRAGVTLTVSPRQVHNGSVATFRGRLRGGPGQLGAVVSIYAVTGGARRRIPVETVNSDVRGRFVYRYRFRSIAGRSTFRFQAVVPRQSGYPYAAGKSSIKTVRAHP